MLLFIDHYDSFAHILIDYFSQIDQEVIRLKSDEIDFTTNFQIFDAVIIGPGPGHPKDLTYLYPHIKRIIELKIPILGICLGHQLLAQYYNAKIIRAQNIMHGQCSEVNFIQHILYTGIKSPVRVTRYHSLIVDIDSLPNDLFTIAKTKRNELMGFSHKNLPIYGIQYHPEAYLTEFGLQTLRNFILSLNYNSNNTLTSK